MRRRRSKRRTGRITETKLANPTPPHGHKRSVRLQYRAGKADYDVYRVPPIVKIKLVKLLFPNTLLTKVVLMFLFSVRSSFSFVMDTATLLNRAISTLASPGS